MKYFKSKKGFTLIELIITLAILLLVLTLCFQTFYYIYNSYNKNEEDWIVQQDVRKISDWIDIKIKTAYILEIYLKNPDSFTAEDYFYYLYEDNGGVYYRKPTETAGTLLAGETIKVNYLFKEASPNALNYEITGNDLKSNTEKIYSVKGTVLILNITADKSINYYTADGVSSGGTCIRFKTTTDPDGIKGMIDIN